MNKVRLDIKDIVRKELKETRHERLNKSISKMNNLQGDDLIVSYISTSIKLMNEGYEMQEIESEINEVVDVKSQIQNIDIAGGITKTLWNTIKEMGVYWVITAIFKNMDKSTAMNIARLATKITPLDVLRPFKNKEYCIKYGPVLLDGLLEVIARWAMENFTGASKVNEKWSDIGNVFLGNAVGTLIQNTGTSESIANTLCPMFHKN